jgi:hypothetical protein
LHCCALGWRHILQSLSACHDPASVLKVEPPLLLTAPAAYILQG